MIQETEHKEETITGMVRQSGNYGVVDTYISSDYTVKEKEDAANKSYTVEVIKNNEVISVYKSREKTSMTNQEYIDEKKEIMGTVITDFNNGTIDKIANKKGV